MVFQLVLFSVAFISGISTGVIFCCSYQWCFNWCYFLLHLSVVFQLVLFSVVVVINDVSTVVAISGYGLEVPVVLWLLS